jgi:hypothetical protein
MLTAGTIFDAVKMAGVRALVSAGWGGLGGVETPEEVFILKGKVRWVKYVLTEQGIYRTTGCSPTAESRLYAITEVRPYVPPTYHHADLQALVQQL